MSTQTLTGIETQMEVMGEEGSRDRLGRRRVPATRRAELVAEYGKSALTQAAFARRAGVRYPTFAHWVQQARKKSAQRPGETAATGTVRFAQVRVGAQPPATGCEYELSVTLPGAVVARGRDAVALAALVRALLSGG